MDVGESGAMRKRNANTDVSQSDSEWQTGRAWSGDSERNPRRRSEARAAPAHV